MSDTTQIATLEKLRNAWLPAVEFLFGTPAAGITFAGYEVDGDLAKPETLLDETTNTVKTRIPARSFTNDVMLLADIIQEMVRALYPLKEGAMPNNLSEGAAVYGAITAIKQVFGEETLDSYLNALKDNGFAYYDAFSYVAVLLTEDPQGIKKVRTLKPYLYEVEREDFAAAGIELERKICDILTYTFRN